MLESSSSSRDIVPILSLSNPAVGIAMLETVFGFRRDTGGIGDSTLMGLGDQKLHVTSAGSVANYVRPHHLALSVPDVDDAMRECIERGGQLAASMTPNGPLEIAEFWRAGVRYVFFDGPEGALIEFCTKKEVVTNTKWGHDHIGIQCDDILKPKVEFIECGCSLLAEYTLQRPEGDTEVAFLGRGSSVVELFSPPKVEANTNNISTVGWIGVRDA